jgi:hypothetical protein
MGLVLAVVAMFATTALVDLRSRRLIEPWQVERLLDLPIVGALPATGPSLLPVQPPASSGATAATPPEAVKGPAAAEQEPTRVAGHA